MGGLLAWCGWASAYPAGTDGGKLVWGISLAVVAAVALLADGAWRRGHRRWVVPRPLAPWPPPERSHDRRWVLEGMGPWLLLTLVVVTWEALGIDTGRHQPHLTLSALTLAFRPMRAATFLVWIALGLGFVAIRLRARAVPGAIRPRRWREASGTSRAVVVPAVLVGADRVVHRLARLAQGASASRRVWLSSPARWGRGAAGTRAAVATAIRWALPATANRWPVPVRAASRVLARSFSATSSSLVLAQPGYLFALLEGDSRGVGVGFWIGVVVVAGAIEVVARRSSGRLCTFEELLRWISEPLLAEAVVIAAWVYAGWHLFAH